MKVRLTLPVDTKLMGQESPSLRLECLPAGYCEVCGRLMTRGSGGKWICRACGYMLTCCDP